VKHAPKNLPHAGDVRDIDAGKHQLGDFSQTAFEKSEKDIFNLGPLKNDKESWIERDHKQKRHGPQVGRKARLDSYAMTSSRVMGIGGGGPNDATGGADLYGPKTPNQTARENTSSAQTVGSYYAKSEGNHNAQISQKEGNHFAERRSRSEPSANSSTKSRSEPSSHQIHQKEGSHTAGTEFYGNAGREYYGKKYFGEENLRVGSPLMDDHGRLRTGVLLAEMNRRVEEGEREAKNLRESTKVRKLARNLKESTKVRKLKLICALDVVGWEGGLSNNLNHGNNHGCRGFK